MTFQALHSYMTKKLAPALLSIFTSMYFHARTIKSSARGAERAGLRWANLTLVLYLDVNHSISSQTDEHDEDEAHVDTVPEHISASAFLSGGSAHDDCQLEVAVPLSSLYFAPQHSL